MPSLGHDYFDESRLQAMQSAAWLRRCNGAMLGVMLGVIGISLLMVVGALMAGIAGVGRRTVGFEDLPLIALCIFLVLAFARICLDSYRRGVDELAERERRLQEMETLLMAARLAAESGNRQLLETTLANTTLAKVPAPEKLAALCLPDAHDTAETVIRFEDLRARVSRNSPASP